MSRVCIAFICGMFIGANLGIIMAALLRMAGDLDWRLKEKMPCPGGYDKNMPDIEDVIVD